MRNKNSTITELIEFTECEGVIYKIVNLKGSIYIGQTINLQKRIEAYIRADKKLEKQRKIYNSIKKYGWENHTFEIIECCEEYELNIKERYYQELFDSVENGMNCRYTQTDDRSGSMSQETKDKLSKIMKGKYVGENNPMYGKDWRQGKTLEELQQHSTNMSNSLKGLLVGERNGMYGKTGELHHNFGGTITQAQKDAISVKNKEWYKNNDHPKAKLVLHLETGIFYRSITEAAFYYGYNTSTLKSYLEKGLENNTGMIIC